MSRVRQIVALGHQARNQAQIKVRQPLPRAVVEADAAGAMADELAALIRIELNVETVETCASFDDLSEEIPVPNFRTLGPRLGPLGNKAGAWIREQQAADLRSQFQSGSIAVTVDGTSVDLVAEDVVFDRVLSSHLILSEEGGKRVVLDTMLDDRLRAKGWVRELTHRIQMARKNAGFEVTDRIAMTYQADEALGALVDANRDEIAEEILAVSVEVDGSSSGDYRETIEFDGMSMIVDLTRVSMSSAAEED